MNDKISSFKKLINLLSKEKKEISFIYLYGFLSGLVGLTLPLGIQAIINLIGGNQVSTSWIILVVLVVMGVIITSLMQIMQIYITENFQQKIFVRSAFEFAYRIPKMNLRILQDRYPPELINRFFDTLTVQKGLPKILIDFSTAIFQIILGVLLLSFYHPFFILFGFILIIIVFIIFRFSFPIGMKTSILESKYKYKIAYWLEEIGRTLETFKLAGKNQYPENKTDALVSDYLKARKAHFKVLLFQFFNLVAFKVIIATGLLVIGGFLVFNQQMNIGQFVAAEIIILLIINSTEKLILSVETIYDVLTGIEKLSEVTEVELEPETGIPVNSNKDGFEIDLNNVTYYNFAKSIKLIDNLSVRINKGEKIFLAGFPLSGKSAFLQLMSSLYTDFEGKISYDGVPLSNINLFSLRQSIGDTLNKEDIFIASLYENLTFGRDVDLEVVQEAVEVAGLREFVSNLPDGYNTILPTSGFGLSRQEIIKIKLARCLVLRPKLMLIEDTIDLLKPSEKEKIINFLEKCSSTVVVISTDEKIAKKFDRVMILNKGSVLAFDKYDVLKNEPWFSQLIN